MEELREAAKHYLETASEGYKQRARIPRESGESDEDFYIRETNRGIRKCNVCAKLLVGLYFCCTKCELFKGYNYNLCVKCFYGETFQHNHDSFADNHSVQMMHNEGRSKPSCVIEKPEGLQLLQPPDEVQQTNVSDKGKDKQDRPPTEAEILEVVKEGMEKLARIATAHYEAAPPKVKYAADAFRRSMFQQTGKDSLTQDEFLAVMKNKGYTQYARKHLFQMLAKDGNHVTMSEALTLYYIVLSGRPFCSHCKYFIPDMFFCCSKCPAGKYALCLDCYESKGYDRHKSNKHDGDDDVFFLDYTVLHTRCTSATATPQSPNLQPYQPTPESSSKAIIVKKDELKNMVTIFSAVLPLCTAALNFATAMCTIM